MAGRPRIILDPYSAQPSGAPLIADTDLTKGLVEAWLPNTKSYISCNGPLIRERQVPSINSPGFSEDFSGGPFGFGRRLSSEVWYKEGANLPSAEECTLLLVFKPAAISATQFFYGFGNSATNNSLCALGHSSSGAVPQFWVRGDTGTTSYATSASALSTSEFAVLVGVRSVLGNYTTLYRDGIVDATAAATATGTLTLNRTALGAIYRTTLGVGSNGYHCLALAWKRPLSSSEIFEVSKNPYQVFARPSARIFSFPPAAGGSTGTLAATESGADTASFAGDVIVQGALAATESGADTAAFAGDVLVQGTLAATESGSDTAALAGDVLVQGALAATESGSDTAAFLGSGALPAITGTLAATESGSDTAALAGDVLVQGALAATESGADVAAFAGALSGGPVAGTLAATETGSDTASIAGDVLITGALAATESGSDTAAFTSGALTANPKIIAITDVSSTIRATDASNTIRVTAMPDWPRAA